MLIGFLVTHEEVRSSSRMKTVGGKHGTGEIVIESPCCATPDKGLFNPSQPVTVHATSPLKFLLPTHTGSSNCRWIFPITYGGGLVGGDTVEVKIEVRDHCCCLLTSQESTKIYHCEDEQLSCQTLKGKICEGALLCVLPDYVVCYKDARYKQTQVFEMTQKSNLVYLDWLTSGRIARQESWEFTSYHNKIDVIVDGELIIRDNMELCDRPLLPMKQAMRSFQTLGTCIILGEKMDSVSKELHKQFSQVQSFGEKLDKETIVSISKVEHRSGISGVYIRFLATTTTKGYGVIKEIVKPLLSILGADPFENKY